MKIAFYSGDMGKKYASHIIELLKGRLPQHQYNHLEQVENPDVWHCMAPHASLRFIPNAHRSVISLLDMRFITHPEIFSLYERLFLFPLYRYHCRHAARLITHNSTSKRRLVDSLGLDASHVEICSALVARRDDSTISADDLLAFRAKFELPDNYILIAGEMDTMHGHTTMLHAVLSSPHPFNAVIYGRRTTHSDVLLQAVRDANAANRIQFIYELDPQEVSLLYRLSMVVLYFPTFESSVMPIVEALHQHVPMVLSDTPLNRETAAQAAIYVEPYDQEALVDALKRVLYNESFRGQLIAQCWVESKRYSDEQLAQQLAQIYESVP
ncbi:MAG: glycosyltransferase [Rikenellaceae bacterium]